MPDLEKRPAQDAGHEEVLTLAEAASYLRVPEAALTDLLARNAIPAQQIGGEWRFLKGALADWLGQGYLFRREFKGPPPPWAVHAYLVEELVPRIEKYLLSKLAAPGEPATQRGSKQAVLKHFGVFREDPDLEAMLAEIYTRRKAAAAGSKG